MIPYYDDYISASFKKYLKEELSPYPGVKDLFHVGTTGGLENKKSMQFVCDLYEKVGPKLNDILNQRIEDRKFIDERVKTYYQFNRNEKIDFLDDQYRTILGDEDSNGRIVIGPQQKNYCGKSSGKKVAPIPQHLEGFHVTLFGPPDDPKLSINAMNAYHRKLKSEPAIVEEILKTNTNLPKWGADDEDSKTPLRSDLVTASENLTGCFNETISFTDQKKNKTYKLADEKLSQPIKRFPGLALPCTFLYYKECPIPLHIYDFALHLFEHWNNPKALTFYVPKLENEEEAAYIKLMIESAEKMIQLQHPNYTLGTVRVIIVLENPRAVFRVNEIMDELYPYFVGASLGWHDYLGSTARLMKEDGNYRIPVKADPDIVIKYIKASHELLANVVGERGGIKIGGMYGILPIDNDLESESFQITIRGFFRDVITQMKRNLSGYWVAHPDFIRIGIAIVEAWSFYSRGEEEKLKGIIDGLLNKKYAKEIWEFVKAKDIESLDIEDPLYDRALIVADIKESNFIANNHPDEIRYNVFQMLQYLTDWLSGNGCVALPTQIKGIPARVMDDLATAERSRWEVWHEINHGRFSVEEFLQIAHEEMNFIRRDLSNETKIVQIKYTNENAKWYDVAFKLMLQLMTSKKPVEFATELLLPFTIDSIRNDIAPWDKLHAIDSDKYFLEEYVDRYNYYFEMCGAHAFAKDNVQNLALNLETIEKSIMNFEIGEVLSAASFHGDIGQSLKTLDTMAKTEQSKVTHCKELLKLTHEYQTKFGMKFLVSAKGKTTAELLAILKIRIENPQEVELANAKKALLEITLKRIEAHPFNDLKKKLEKIFKNSGVNSCQIGISSGRKQIQTICFSKDGNVNKDTQYQIASLSKSIGTAYAFEIFQNENIPLNSKVNQVLERFGSSYRLPSGDEVELQHLTSHTALNMHYVNGIDSEKEMPPITELLLGNVAFAYDPIKVINPAGTKFQYSGAGFILLEYIVRLIQTRPFSLEFSNRPASQNFAKGIQDNGEMVSGGYKIFPLFAAGMWGTASSVLEFLEKMAVAYHCLEGSDDISHDTAVKMTYGVDKGTKDFMNALIGHGVFTVQAGENEFLLHQGANDGYRAIYLYCYKGPDRYKGLTILCNGELNGVILNALLSQEILRELNISGIDYTKFSGEFSTRGLTQEEVVNIGYKNLLLLAFLPTLPEKIEGANKIDPLSKFDLLQNSKISKVSNQRFARAENLISPYEPVFNPREFGSQGKIMDSWETARHNSEEFDFVHFSLEKCSKIQYIFISTKFHDGNQVEFIEILADGKILLEKTQLAGHSAKKLKLKSPLNAKDIEVRVYPDGGLTRLRLFSEIPKEFEGEFSASAENIRFEELIPMPEKPLGIDPLSYKTKNESKNLASLASGAKVISASDEHYAPAINVLSPFPPINMFDGLESKRSRIQGHKEELTIALSKKSEISHVVLNFRYFVNNNPSRLTIAVEENGHWIEVVSDYFCKPYAGNSLKIPIEYEKPVEKMRFNFIPDGGVNRIQVF